MNPIADRVVAYRLPEEGGEEMFGLCLRRESDTLRVMVLQKESNREMPLRSVLRKLSDEEGIVNSLEDRFGVLQAKLAKERGAGAQSKNYRLQETMLQWAAHRLEGIDTQEWQRFAKERHPSSVTKAVGCAAASIATDAKLVSSAWADAQKLFSKGKEMVADLRRAGEKQMSSSLYNSLEEVYISDSTLSYALVAQESPFLSILHKWITAVVDYQRARYMEDGEVELQQQLTGCQNSLQSARVRRGSLMEQAELINTGNCYIRTQTVRSVPVDCVLHLLTAEKVTTRQYLLKEMVPLESLDMLPSQQPLTARSARGSRQEGSVGRTGSLSARTPDASYLGGNCTNTGVEIPPIHIPKVESARVGTWVGGRLVRRQRSVGKDSDGNTTGSSNSNNKNHNSAATTIPKVSPRHAGVATAPEALDPEVKSPWAAASASPRVGPAATSPSSSPSAPSPASPSVCVEGTQRNEPASPGRAVAAVHSGTEPMQVLTDVRNNFKNVQTVLLDCLEDYQKLEDTYASTVEQSRQLLQTLESRDQLILRLQQDLDAATASQAQAKSANNHLRDGSSHETMRHRELEDMYTSAIETQDTFDVMGSTDPDSFEQRFEQMLHDTLEFLRGAETAPTNYESETNEE